MRDDDLERFSMLAAQLEAQGERYASQSIRALCREINATRTCGPMPVSWSIEELSDDVPAAEVDRAIEEAAHSGLTISTMRHSDDTILPVSTERWTATITSPDGCAWAGAWHTTRAAAVRDAAQKFARLYPRTE